MFEIDKNAFGEFLAKQRKLKGYTQKELAEKLFVSDKAVSKWERAQSMPDISLLIPLAEILEVSVTELLEGRRLDVTSPMDAKQVESLVKKALTFSEDSPEKKREQRKKSSIIFGTAALCAILELCALMWKSAKTGIDGMPANLFIFEGMSFGFGIYVWFFMKKRLPAYYDENKISVYSDGVFRMNVPGLYFNNGNWQYIVKSLRLWSIISMLLLPAVYLVSAAINMDIWNTFGFHCVVLFLYLGGLFLPCYVVVKKSGKNKRT